MLNAFLGVYIDAIEHPKQNKRLKYLIKFLQKKQKDHDPRCSYKEQLIRTFINIKKFIGFWDHLNAFEKQILVDYAITRASSTRRDLQCWHF